MLAEIAHLRSEMVDSAHYSSDTWDSEVVTFPGGWLEVAEVSDGKHHFDNFVHPRRKCHSRRPAFVNMLPQVSLVPQVAAPAGLEPAQCAARTMH